MKRLIFLAVLFVFTSATVKADTITGTITIFGKTTSITNEIVNFSFETSIAGTQVDFVNLILSSTGPLVFTSPAGGLFTEFLNFTDSDGDILELHTSQLSLLNYVSGSGPLQFLNAPLYHCPGATCQADYGLFPPQVFDDAGGGVGNTSLSVMVPEPSTLLLLSLAMAGLLFTLRFAVRA